MISPLYPGFRPTKKFTNSFPRKITTSMFGLLWLCVFLGTAAPSLWGVPPPAARKEAALARTEAVQRAALSANPNSPDLHGALGETLMREHKYEEAVQELGIAAQGLPDSLRYNMSLAEALIGWGHNDVAIELLNALAPRFHQYAQFHYDLGLAEYNLGKDRQATQEFEETLRVDPNLDQAKFLLAACKGRTGDLKGAADGLRPLAKAHPKELVYWVALAEVLQKMGELPEALRCARHALALEPGDPGAMFRTAVILLQAEDYAAARPLLERVVKLAPDNPQAHVGLVTAYSHLGEREAARKESEIVARLSQKQAEHAGPSPGGQNASPSQP